MSCGAETEANALFTSLMAGEDVTLPDIDLDDPNYNIPQNIIDALRNITTKLTNADLTTGAVDGSGTFDALMRGFKAHLQQEFEKGRITGADYTKAYIALTESAMGQGVAYLLGRDAAYWQSVTAQLAALTAVTQLEIVKMQLVTAKFAALGAKSDYALTKLKLASESVSYCTAQYNLENMLPQELLKLVADTDNAEKQGLMLVAQTENVKAETSEVTYRVAQLLPQQKLLLVAQTGTEQQQTLRITAEVEKSEAEVDTLNYRLTNILPKEALLLTAQTAVQTAQGSLLGSQKLNTDAETTQITYRTTNLLPAELTKLTAETSVTTKQGLKIDEDILGSTYTRLSLMPAQLKLVSEQMETQRAQTLDTRSDGTVVAGVLGRQKSLYDQQKDSYQRDSELKAAKMFADSWTVQKTIDEGLLAPVNFQNASVDAVMGKIKTNNGLV